jgi:hypothetical protein
LRTRMSHIDAARLRVANGQHRRYVVPVAQRTNGERKAGAIAAAKAKRARRAARNLALLAAISVLVAGCSAGGGHATGPTRSEAGPAPVRYRLAAEVVPTTTTTLPPRPPTTRAPRTSGPTNARPRPAPGDPWGCIRQYESGGTTDPAGANLPGGGYYQFEDSTWHAAGGTGHASDHSYAEQTARAQAWQASHGWGQWSTARRCGLA